MFDRFFRPQNCENCQKAIEQPDIYTFMDISQVNSRNFNEAHWDTLQWIMNKMKNFQILDQLKQQVWDVFEFGYGE